MSSELKASWSGPLKSKRKNELQQICRQLGIEYKSESLKADLEQQIRKRFKDFPGLQDDERFINLDHSGSSASPNASGAVSSRRSNRARSVSRPPREHDDDEQSSVEDDRGRPNASSTRRKSAASSVSTNSEQAAPQNILVTLINPARNTNHQSLSKSNSNVTSSPHLAKRTGQPVLDSFNSFVRCATCFTITAIQAIQTTFSSPWKLCIIAIVLELFFVIYSTMPLRQTIHVHAKSDGLPVGIPEPIVRLFNQITSKSFLSSFLEYMSLTVMVPFVIAGLMNVPNSQRGEQSKKDKFQATRDLKPSVFIYCATRLAVLALIHLVFYPNHRFGWPNQTPYHPQPSLNPSSLDVENNRVSQSIARNIHLSGFESIQYVTTAFAMVFALYQLIRSCP